MGGALTLGGRRLIMKNNNQLVVGVRGGLDVGEEGRWGQSVWGDTVPYFGATIQTMKKYIYEIHHCLWMACDQQQLTQQPTKNGCPQQREVWRVGAMSGWRVVNMIPLLWQKLSNKEKIKTNTSWP